MCKEEAEDEVYSWPEAEADDSGSLGVGCRGIKGSKEQIQLSRLK